MIKTQATCHDCGKPFFLEDAAWCRHHEDLGIGSKTCPNCGTCICHGETREAIEERFRLNIAKGKFVISRNPNWTYQCVGNKEVEVSEPEEDPAGPWTDPISGEVDHEAMAEDLGVDGGYEDEEEELE